MKGYLIDAQERTIHIIEVGGLESATKLVSPTCTGLNEIFSFRNGDTVFADDCGFYPEKERMNDPKYMGMITSDMEITYLWPFFGRILILGCSINSNDCTYEDPCDVKSTREELLFWLRFFKAEDGIKWLEYNFYSDSI